MRLCQVTGVVLACGRVHRTKALKQSTVMLSALCQCACSPQTTHAGPHHARGRQIREPARKTPTGSGLSFPRASIPSGMTRFCANLQAHTCNRRTRCAPAAGYPRSCSVRGRASKPKKVLTGAFLVLRSCAHGIPPALACPDRTDRLCDPPRAMRGSVSATRRPVHVAKASPGPAGRPGAVKSLNPRR